MAAAEFDICVIGAGSGGLVVAAGGATLGAKVALIEKHKMGGDCLNYGCVPSKALLKSAKVAHLMRTADHYAIGAAQPQVSLPAVMRRVAQVIKGIEPNDSPERFRGLGVEVIFGHGRFQDAHTVTAGERTITARNFVIATGSRPGVPPIAGLDSVPFLTNETVFELNQDVPSLIVIGAGPIGSELAQAFCRLGSAVTVVDLALQNLPREDAELAAIVRAQMERDGVKFHLGVTPSRVEGAAGNIELYLKNKEGNEIKLSATHLLVAAGRKMNIEDLGLDAAGVAVEKGRIVSDARLRTTQKHIYVCGDAAGALQFTHVAEHHAGVVLRNAIFKLPAKAQTQNIPWCTFTEPELARVGLSETEAKAQNVAHKVYVFPYEENDRARAESETEGCAKLVTDPKGRILGAAIVGAHAGELIAEYALAIAKGMKAADLSGVIHTYPTFAQINRRVADQRMKEGFTPSRKRWIQKIFGLRGAQ
jgi:pyruvate/2-oxoglutarate dehydrogenase complex dihydrolipoamide dehydrogenase (E3) component